MRRGTRASRVRRVAVVTGTRAEYGLLRSAMEAIDRHRRLKLQTVVTGIHLLRKFGHTVDEITGDGWKTDARVRMQRGVDSDLDQAEGLARGVTGIARFLQRADTDIVLVLGDRIEAMAGALASVTTGRLLAHIHGGDIAPGDLDERLRHSITKLAQLHLAATRQAQRRIIRMGEDPERVKWVGAPGLDRLREIARDHRRTARERKHALIIQHPCGRPAEQERKVMNAILRAVEVEGLARTIIYPNTDRGHAGIIAAIEAHRRGKPADVVRVDRSLRRDDYLAALIDADVLVGNSSSGVIEAPTAGTPSINVGARQRGRQAGGRSVVDADESIGSIRAALRASLGGPRQRGGTVYGAGCAGPRIAEELASVPLNPSFLRKINTY